MESTHREVCLYQRMFGQKALKVYILVHVYKFIALVSEYRLSFFVFTVIFCLLRRLLITLILDERYMSCSMKVQS